MPQPLTMDRITHEMRGLQGWAFVDGALVRDFTFAEPDEAREFSAAANELIGSRPATVEVIDDPVSVHVGLCAAENQDVTMADIEIAHRLDAQVGKT